jgi:hypothetical protein
MSKALPVWVISFSSEEAIYFVNFVANVENVSRKGGRESTPCKYVSKKRKADLMCQLRRKGASVDS